MVCVGRAHLEASAERWSRLLGLLEELWRWICLKDEELAKQMPLGGDVPTLLQQQNYCTVRIAATGIVPAEFTKFHLCLCRALDIFHRGAYVSVTFKQQSIIKHLDVTI